MGLGINDECGFSLMSNRALVISKLPLLLGEIKDKVVVLS